MMTKREEITNKLVVSIVGLNKAMDEVIAELKKDGTPNPKSPEAVTDRLKTVTSLMAELSDTYVLESKAALIDKFMGFLSREDDEK